MVHRKREDSGPLSADPEMIRRLPRIDGPLQPGRHLALPVPFLPFGVAVDARRRGCRRRRLLGKAAGCLQVGQGQAVPGHLDTDPHRGCGALDLKRHRYNVLGVGKVPRFGGARSFTLAGIPHRLHRLHASRRLGGHVARGGIERGVSGNLLHHLERRPGGQRVGNTGVEAASACWRRAAACRTRHQMLPAAVADQFDVCHIARNRRLGLLQVGRHPNASDDALR